MPWQTGADIRFVNARPQICGDGPVRCRQSVGSDPNNGPVQAIGRVRPEQTSRLQRLDSVRSAI